MTAIEIKSELQKMIENETDLRLLEAIRTLLQKASLNPLLKEKLTERALKSEEDIEEGRIFSKYEAISRSNS